MRSDSLRKFTRGLKMVLLTAVCMAAGAYLHKCQSPGPGGAQDSCVADTVTYIDTVLYFEPTPKKEVSLGTKIVFLPVSIRKGSGIQNIPQDGNIAMQNIPDSVEVVIPITQKEYEGEDYHAWVSGYEPNLDSISVFPRREVVSVREPPDKPKRWGIGVFAGYGITPKGLQPCAGVSVSYTILSF